MKILLVLLLLFCPYLIKSFEEISIEISIKEEEENGIELIDLRKQISSLSLLKNSEGYKMKFVRPCLNIYFDEKNSFIIRSFKFDREEICPYEKVCYLNCNLFIEKEEIKLIKLKINIQDINDHKPKFLKEFYFYEFDENLLLNSHIQLEQAEDKDFSSEYSIKNYYLNSSSIEHFPFQLHYDNENHLLELILIEKLNKIKYLFQLFVIDENNQTDFCFIEINILKTEQNLEDPPEFQLKFYEFFISNPNETFIGQVEIKNSLNKNKIIYKLISSYENFHLFQINQTTGEIFRKANQQMNSFDHFYQIFIEASYSNSLSTLTTVQIYFNFTFSSNQNQLFIQIFIPKLFQKNQNQNQIFIKENSTIPLTILQLFISSPSSSSSLQMISSIHQNYFQLKQLDQQSFELILLKSFDYEFIQNISLDFISNFTIKSIEIIIENINDCQPTLNQTNFHFDIQENNQVPLLLNTFQGFDQDYLNNITYRIQTSDEQMFSINSTSGELWILESFDREMKLNYSFLICVFDQIYETCSSVLINILDENDNVCQFNSSSITLKINENLPSNIYLTQIQAFDPDDQQNGTIHYSFSTKTSYLNLNPTTGIIRTTKTSFDYEFIQSYSLLIKGCDNLNSLPSFCCYLELNLNLIDLDDNSPYLIYPSSTNDLFLINYTNKTMPRLKAFDNDFDIKNRVIYFRIIGGSLNSSITIDYYSGQLFLSSTSQLPLYGTLLISISSQTITQLTILIHDNQTDLPAFLMSIQQSSFSFTSASFYLILFSISTFLLLIILFLFYFLKQKQTQLHNDDPLMNTPSTTTLSTRSISTTATTNKKFYDTYYSFEDTVHPQIIHV